MRIPNFVVKCFANHDSAAPCLLGSDKERAAVLARSDYPIIGFASDYTVALRLKELFATRL